MNQMTCNIQEHMVLLSRKLFMGITDYTNANTKIYAFRTCKIEYAPSAYAYQMIILWNTSSDPLNSRFIWNMVLSNFNLYGDKTVALFWGYHQEFFTDLAYPQVFIT